MSLQRKEKDITMNRPPTPAGPLFTTRTTGQRRESTLTSDIKTRPRGVNGAHPLTKPNAVVQQSFQPGSQTAVYDLNAHTMHRGPRVRQPLADVTNGQRQQTELGQPSYVRRPRQISDFSSRYGTNKHAMPFLEEQNRVNSGKSILRSNVEKPPIDKSKQVRFGGETNNYSPTTPGVSRKGVKFNTSENPETRSPVSSAQSRTKDLQSSTNCEVKGTAIRERSNLEAYPKSRIRIVRRSQNATANAFSIFRRKLQQNLDMKYSTETTTLPSECVIRRQDPGGRLLPHPPSQRISLKRQTFQPARQQQRQLLEENHTAEQNVKDKGDRQGKTEGSSGVNNIDRRFSYKLAEKAEEYFTRNLRHLQENTAKPNLIKTYVVEDNPNDLLDNMEKTPPVTLTTKNLEIHNNWLASVDTKESYNQKVNAREKRIRRWIEEMQSSSRLNHMRVVNIVVKDRGFLVQNARDDVMDRMSQVPSQVPSQVMA